MAERTVQDYLHLMDDVTAACRSFAVMGLNVSDEDLDAAIATVQRAEDFGALVDPTAYRARIRDGGLARQRRLLTAFRTFRNELAALCKDAPK